MLSDVCRGFRQLRFVKLPSRVCLGFADFSLWNVLNGGNHRGTTFVPFATVVVFISFLLLFSEFFGA